MPASLRKFIFIFIYYDDLHRIDVTTGEVSIIETTGTKPCARSTPIIEYYNHCIYLWGGFYQNVWPTELFVLNLETFEWISYEQNVSGRTAVPWCIVDNKIYSFSGSKSGGLLIIDMDNNIVKVDKTTGSEPVSTYLSAQMVKADKYFFFFGGRSPQATQTSLVYALDYEKKWWFVFPIAPDNDTTTSQDGFIDELGLFEIPRISSAACAYNEEEREIVITLGSQLYNPPPLHIIGIGHALGVLHLRDDMLDMLNQ